ncbi:MAG: hypothetical protein V9G04_17290 [Nocardioides sp.]
MAVAASASPTTVAVGETVTVTLAVTNYGPYASYMTMELVYSGVQFVSASSSSRLWGFPTPVFFNRYDMGVTTETITLIVRKTANTGQVDGYLSGRIPDPDENDNFFSITIF